MYVFRNVCGQKCLGCQTDSGYEPSQFAVGTNGGGSQLIMAITLLLEANPDWVVITLDISNAYNEIQR